MRLFLVLTAALVLAACGDTSEIDNAPKATVQEPLKEKAPEPPKEEAKAPAKRVVLPVDPGQSSIGFLGAKVTGTHEGGVKGFSGALQWAGDAPVGLAISVDMTSLFADKEKLTGHLKSPDFFNVEAQPTAMFKSTKFEAGEGGAYTVSGQMTLNGQTKEISFPATFETSDAGTKGDAKFQINRQDFGITYPGKPDDLIKDEVALTISLMFPKRG